MRIEKFGVTELTTISTRLGRMPRSIRRSLWFAPVTVTVPARANRNVKTRESSESFAQCIKRLPFKTMQSLSRPSAAQPRRTGNESRMNEKRVCPRLTMSHPPLASTRRRSLTHAEESSAMNRTTLIERPLSLRLAWEGICTPIRAPTGRRS